MQEQAKYLDWKKSNLSDREFLVIGDFSENYAFIRQDAAQGYHWTNSQATLHPFVFYYKYEGNFCHGSYVLLLECNTHDTIAVHLFQRKLIIFLKVKFEVLKIAYFSDGCAAQYKNCKNLIKLCYHKEDFGIPAEWHFFATSHGKEFVMEFEELLNMMEFEELLNVKRQKQAYNVHTMTK